jgi:hypothetical protein
MRLIVGEPPPTDAGNKRAHPLRIRHLAGRVEEIEVRETTRWVLVGAVMKCAVERAL